MKDPMNNMDPNAVRVVHVCASDHEYHCGRLVRTVMWGSQDTAAGKTPTCVECVAKKGNTQWRT